MIAGAFALSTSAQNTEKRGDNAGSISIEASEDLSCIPISFSLTNPTTKVVAGEVDFEAPAGAKFTEGGEEEELVEPNTERAGTSNKKGKWTFTPKATDGNAKLAVAFLTMSNPKVALAEAEGELFKVFLDASGLADGEYEVKMNLAFIQDQESKKVFVVTGSYNGVDADTPELVVPLVISGGKAEAGSAGVNKITIDEEAVEKGIYNIQGMKIRQTVPGRLYIVNGKKVIAQ